MVSATISMPGWLVVGSALFSAVVTSTPPFSPRADANSPEMPRMRGFCVWSRKGWSYANPFRCREHRCVRVERASAVEVGEILVTEVLDGGDDRAGGAVAQCAERLPVDRVGDV